MNKPLRNTAVLFASTLLISSCGENSTSNPAESVNAITETENLVEQSVETTEALCPSDSNISYVCGLMNAEDLLSPGDSGLILSSGMSGENVPGHIYLLNPEDNRWHDLLSSSSYSVNQDNNMFAGCPGPVDIDDFSAHGLALKELSMNTFDLYVTGHGAREAIEVFELNLNESQGALSWKGCVLLDPAVMHNSVAILPNNGFVTTQFMRWEDGFEAVFNEEPNGGVVIWNPGSEAEFISGSELAGANGIAVSEDGINIYVAAFGSNELVRFDMSQQPIAKQAVTLDITLDNVRWGEPGKLLTAGGKTSGEGWAVVEIDAATLETQTVGDFGVDVSMQGISTALQLDNEIWVGTYAGDRIGVFTKQ